MDCSPPGSSVQEVSQARILEWVACPSPGDFPDSGIEAGSLALQAGSLLTEPLGNPRILEWVAYPSPGDLSHPGIEPGSPSLQADSLPAELPGKQCFLSRRHFFL